MFMKFKILVLKNSFQRLLLCASYLSYVSSLVEWILYLKLLLKIWLKLKFIYLYIYYEILRVLLALISLTLPLFRKCFFLLLVFFCFFFFDFVKPKLFYQYLFESLQKQQLRGILLNMYVFNFINFTKLCRLLATFFNTQKTYQSCLEVAVRVIWLPSVGQYQINVKQRCVCTPWNFQRWTTPN